MFHSNQEAVAQEIYRYFRDEEGRYATLKSEPQAGKTGAFHCIMKKMKEWKKDIQCIILCGSSETILRGQAIRDAENYGNGDASIYFRQDFKECPLHKFQNAIIVIDESHLDQSRGQCLDQLLQRVRLSLTGHLDRLREMDSYIVSVSATPFSEQIHMRGFENDFLQKKMFRLEPGEGYRGFQYFWEHDKIKQIPSSDRELYNYHDILEILKSYGNKYNIFRVTEKNIKDIEKEHAIQDFNVFCNASKRTSILFDRQEDASDVLYPCISDEPSKPSIIFVKGRMRVGKVIIHKQHIGSVWEFSKDPKTDTILQGLFGRCCGYHTYDIELFGTSNLFRKSRLTRKTEIETYIRGGIPDHAMNVVRYRDGGRKRERSEKHTNMNQTRHPTIPICIEISMETNKHGAFLDPVAMALDSCRDKASLQEFTPVLLERLKELQKDYIQDNSVFSLEQKTEITQWLTDFNIQENGRDISLRNVNEENTSYRKQILAIQGAIIKKCPTVYNITYHHICEGKWKPLFMIVFICTDDSVAKRGSIYIIFYTRDPNLEYIAEQYIPETTGKEIYHPDHIVTMEEPIMPAPPPTAMEIEERPRPTKRFRPDDDSYIDMLQWITRLQPYILKMVERGTEEDVLSWEEDLVPMLRECPDISTDTSLNLLQEIVKILLHTSFTPTNHIYGYRRRL